MIHTVSIFAVPILLIIWALDSYLWVLSARLVCGRIGPIRSKPFFKGLCILADGVPATVERWLQTQEWRVVPSWLPWAIVIVAGVLVRQLLVGIAVSVL